MLFHYLLQLRSFTIAKYAKGNSAHTPQNILTLFNVFVYVGSYSFSFLPPSLVAQFFPVKNCLFVSVQILDLLPLQGPPPLLLGSACNRNVPPQAIYQGFQRHESEARRSAFNRSTAPMMILMLQTEISSSLKRVALFS